MQHMSVTAPHPYARSTPGAYRHAAVFYAGLDRFVGKTAPFIRAGVAASEPTLVVVAAEKIDALREELGSDIRGVEFADMNDVGANPARIIPAWQQFVDAHPGRTTRGIGEPIFPERSAAELTECQHHERLLNPALDGSNLFLICPYDTEALPEDVIAEAHRSHPLVQHNGTPHPSDSYDHDAAASGLFDDPLAEPAGDFERIRFDQAGLPEVRALLRRYAAQSGLGPDRTGDLVLAAGELSTNSIRHAGGRGTMRLWRENGHLICEISDRGRIHDPLIDRRRPGGNQLGGWGLWIANQACDLLQLRSFATGTVARLHMQLG
jgi:anti-sigma regulatory factor (Ser/Thr protein kinase)